MVMREEGVGVRGGKGDNGGEESKGVERYVKNKKDCHDQYNRRKCQLEGARAHEAWASLVTHEVEAPMWQILDEPRPGLWADTRAAITHTCRLESSHREVFRASASY